MLSQEQEEALYGMVNNAGMSVGEATIVLLLADVRGSLNRLVELAESDYAEDEERLPRSLGERR